jgi:phenylpyruvate tautomerase PptA (4-oxalocrotonate tautomerase family)
VPVCRIEAPVGIGDAAKKIMLKQITAAIYEAYHIGSTLVILEEWAPENIAINGRLLSEIPRFQELSPKISS